MRRKTTAVRIGNVVLSSEEPVLVQSMLNTSTREVDACVEQAIRIIEAGGRLVGITAPGSEGSGDARGNTPSFA